MITVTIDRGLLEDLAEWLRANPPATGWGTLDRRADAERQVLLGRLAGLAGAHAAGLVVSCNRHHDCSRAPKGHLCCFDPTCTRMECQVRT